MTYAYSGDFKKVRAIQPLSHSASAKSGPDERDVHLNFISCFVSFFIN